MRLSSSVFDHVETFSHFIYEYPIIEQIIMTQQEVR